MDNEEHIPLEVDDAKVRQIIAKIKKSIKSFSITNGKSFILPPRDELFSSKYHLSFLELRNEGLAIEKLLKDAEEQEESNENSSNLIPKNINSHYLDGRFLIFTTHPPIEKDINDIQYDFSLKFGQIVAFHSDSNEILLGMIATKLNEDVYRVFDLSNDFMFTICTSNQICPFPIVLPKELNSSTSFSAGDKVIAFTSAPHHDRKQFSIQSGEVVCLTTNEETDEKNYDVKLSDGSVITTEPQFLTKFDSPFTCKNEQAEEQKQEYLANGIDPTVMLDPKEARKFKNANAKKMRDMKKKAAEAAGNQNLEDQQDASEGSSDKKKEKKKKQITMATRHSLRTKPNSTPDISSSSPNKSTISQEDNRDAPGNTIKLPLASELHVSDQSSAPPPSSTHQIPLAAPPRVIQLQNMQMQHQFQQQYLFQQQMMLQHHQSPHFVQQQTGKTPISQSLTVSPTQFVQYQRLPINKQALPQIQQPIYQPRKPSLGSVMRVNSPNIDHLRDEESQNQEIEHKVVPLAKDESQNASLKVQNDFDDQNSPHISSPSQESQNHLENPSVNEATITSDDTSINSIESAHPTEPVETTSLNETVNQNEPSEATVNLDETKEQNNQIEPHIEKENFESSDTNENLMLSNIGDFVKQVGSDELDELIDQVRSEELSGPRIPLYPEQSSEFAQIKKSTKIVDPEFMESTGPADIGEFPQPLEIMKSGKQNNDQSD